nr:MAG TPA: hypothetical protein [Caudoviricetes sp.]DAQ16115.1 MAG TPA: hypothetical protein [Caudoviricetes sp.]
MVLSQPLPSFGPQDLKASIFYAQKFTFYFTE